MEPGQSSLEPGQDGLEPGQSGLELCRTEVVRNGASDELYLAAVIGNPMILSMIPLLRALINLRGLQTKEGQQMLITQCEANEKKVRQTHNSHL